MTENIGDAVPPVGEADANEADVLEQAEDVTPPEPVSRSESAEVDEFDAAEQGRPVELDPDERR